MQYHECIEKLFACRTGRQKALCLERMKEILKYLGDPQKAFFCVHVAGTNGKGSVCTKVARALEKKYQRVGLFTSPHISSFRERIVINGEMIPVEIVCRLFEQLLPFHTIATFFELTTAMMFVYFAENQVDIAVVEVGLGGKCDATNLCQSILSVITSISLDHTELLGDTKENIALEKAGIIRPNIPVIIGPHVPKHMITTVCEPEQVFQITDQFHHFDEENQAIARHVCAFFDIADEEALLSVPRCRFEKHYFGEKECILDGAHNEDGIKRLFERIALEYGVCSIVAIYGSSIDKNIAACIAYFVPLVERVYFVEAASNKAAASSILLSCVPREYQKKCRIMESVTAAMNLALESSCKLVVVFGSFYIMQEVRGY